jgi:hypothetical protein
LISNCCRSQKAGDDGKGFLAAYLAEKYMLGQGKEAWQQVEQVYKERERSKYFAKCVSFCVKLLTAIEPESSSLATINKLIRFS